VKSKPYTQPKIRRSTGFVRVAFAGCLILIAAGLISLEFFEWGTPGFGPVQFLGLLVVILTLPLVLSTRLFDDPFLWIQNHGTILLALGATIVSLGAVELAANIYFEFFAKPDPPTWRTVAAKDSPYMVIGDNYGKFDVMPRIRFHDFLGYIPRRNTRGRGYTTNTQHFRYSQDLSPKTKNEVRIFVTGGSTAWGAGVNQNALYTTHMEKALGQRFPEFRIRVISAGVSGYSSTQERIFVANFVYRHNPDFVLMLSGWNDALFGYQGSRIHETQSIFNYREIIDRYNNNDFRVLTPPQPSSYPLKTWYLLDAAIFRLKFLNSADLETKLRKIQLPVEEVYKTFLYNARTISALGQANGWQTGVCLQPSLYKTQKQLSRYEKTLIDSDKSVGFSGYNGKIYDIYRARLGSDLRAAGAFYFDCDNAIRKEIEAVFVDSVHMGDRGNRLLGIYLAKKLTPVITAIIKAPVPGKNQSLY